MYLWWKKEQCAVKFGWELCGNMNRWNTLSMVER